MRVGWLVSSWFRINKNPPSCTETSTTPQASQYCDTTL